MRSLVWTVALGALALAAVGCKHDYNVTFVNTTDRDMTATLTGPGDITPSPPSVSLARKGGQAQFHVTVDDDELPANYSWTADGRKGTLVLTDKSRKQQVVTLGPERPTQRLPGAQQQAPTNNNGSSPPALRR